MYQRARSLLINISLLFLAICFSLIVIEFLLRAVFLPSVGASSRDHNKVFMEYDSLLGWRKKQNHRDMVVSEEYRVLEEINSRGIRGPEYPYAKEEGQFRILAIGDSFAEGRMIEFRELFSEVLKARLNDGRHASYEVVNAGTSGYSTDQELLYFQSEGKKYSPDLTVVMFYYNDIWYNSRPKYWRGYKPLFRLEDDTLHLSNVPLPRPDPLVSGTEQGPTKRSLFRTIKDWLSEKSLLFVFVRNRVMRSYDLYTLAMTLHLAERPNGGENAVVRVPDELRVFATSYSSEVRRARDLTGAILREFKAVTASAGSDLLVFYVPSMEEVYVDDWAATKRQYGMKNEVDWSIRQVASELRAICQRHDIACIDPTEDFRAEANKLTGKGSRLYFLKDTHWNPLGHKLAGEILAKYVLSNYSGKVNDK